MIPHQLRRTILVFCICLSAAYLLSQRTVHAQGTIAPGAAGGTPNAFFQALRTIDSQQNAVAATRSYALPGSATAVRQPVTVTPYPTTVRPVARSAPATRSGQTPSSFFRAVREIDSQQGAPNVGGRFVRPAPARQPLGGFRTVAAPTPRDATAEKTVFVGGSNAPKNASILNTDYWLSYPENAWRIISAPYNFDTNDWLVAGGVAATTGLLMLADKEINDTWRDDIRTGGLDDFLDIMEFFGDSQFIVFGSLGGYAVGELIGSERDKEAALLVAQSFVLSAGLTQGLKFAFRRERPDDSRDDQYSFFSSDASKTNSAFPSGHATNAFSMAAVLTNVYDEQVPWLGWVLYPVATMTALARVNNERHWGSDVFLGSALGYFIGRMVVHYSPFRGNQTISLAPMTDGDLSGLRVVHKI
jgi:membrane-associated phospholipid phosphatase